MSSTELGSRQPAHQSRREKRPSRLEELGQAEIKRHRQGLKVDELSSTDVLDVTVFNLGNLARQSIQRQAEPRMLRLIMNQTSHIMMLVEGTSLAVNQWDEKLRAEGWTLGSSDDHHHWVGVRTASFGTTVTPWLTTVVAPMSSWGTPQMARMYGRVDRTSIESWLSTSIISLLEQLADHAESILQNC